MTSSDLRPSDFRNLFDLTGRQAMVVGAGSGIGREMARALAAFGARVCCADRDLVTARESAELAGAGASACSLDVLDPSAIQQAARQFPDLDILILTAATNVRKRLLDYSADEFDRVVHLNLRASFLVIQAFGANMVSRGAGSIIAITSIRAMTTEPGQAIYAATKAGLIQLLRTAAAEWGPSNVRVNLIAPGVVETALTSQITAVPEWHDAYARKSVLGRWAQPDELAGAAVYLASDASSYVTGSVLVVDGGWTAADGRYTPPP